MSEDEFSKDDAKAMASIMTIAMVPLNIFVRGYVSSVLWLWFVVPLGAAPLGVLHAMGMLLLVMVCLGYGPKKELLSSRERLKSLTEIMWFNLLALGFGWLCLLGIQP